jgi:fluoride exporter
VLTPLLVAGAGALGVLARYGLGTAVAAGALPWLTLGINVTGSFALGLLWGSGAGDTARAALGAGFLGGFTTYSTFALQVWVDLDEGRTAQGLVLLGLSVVLGVGAAGAGLALGR